MFRALIRCSRILTEVVRGAFRDYLALGTKDFRGKKLIVVVEQNEKAEQPEFVATPKLTYGVRLS